MAKSASTVEGEYIKARDELRQANSSATRLKKTVEAAQARLDAALRRQNTAVEAHRAAKAAYERVVRMQESRKSQ